MKENNIRKGILIGCGISALLLVGFLGSYAFFISNGTNNPENISTNTGTLALTFADGNAGITESLEFGSSVEKTFTIENTGSLEGVAKINFEDLVNTYLEGSLKYTLSYSETENGTYHEVVTNKNVPVSENSITQVLADNLVIPARAKLFYKLTITLNYLENIDQTADLNALFSTHFILEEGTKVLTSKDILAKLNLTVKEGQPNFAEPATTDETADGLYAMEDDYGTSYYFRGAVENNYVKFAGFYWRIIRINGDGSLRMIYDGTRAYANGTKDENRAVFSSAFNTNSNDAKYVGYMYGPAGITASTSKEQAETNIESSTIKTKLEEWYVDNIKSKGLDQYIADSIFCNDRSTPGSVATGWSSDTGKGYGKNVTAYGATARSNVWNTDVNLVKPQFICQNKNDAFTVSDIEKGNGTLDEKVGLIAADEIVAAGSGKHKTTNYYYYLYKGNAYWSLSPYYFNGSYSSLLYVNINGNFSYHNTSSEDFVVPVISITPEYVSTLVGDGTATNPYRDASDTV